MSDAENPEGVKPKSRKKTDLPKGVGLDIGTMNIVSARRGAGGGVESKRV